MSFTTSINTPFSTKILFSISLVSLLLTACGEESSSNQTSTSQASTSQASTSQASSNQTSTSQASTNQTPSTNTSKNDGCSSFKQQEMLDEVNRIRAIGYQCFSGYKQPASKLIWEGNLAKVSIEHARDMANNNYFSHTSQDGRTFKNRIKNIGYTGNMYGENLAAGTSNITNTVDELLKSETGHCKTFMDPQYTEFAMACAYNADSDYKNYWVQAFGKKPN